MKNYLKHIIVALLPMILTGNAFAQDKLLDRLYSEISDSCVELAYTYESEVTGVRLVGSGNLCIQGDMWYNDANGLKMWCDSKTVWTADVSAQEVIIESVSDEESDVLVNPALLFVRMKELFYVKKSVNSVDDKAVVYVLEPLEDIGLEYFNVEVFKSDASIRCGSFAMEDGSEVKIKVSSMKCNEERPETYFRPSQAFDSSWIVTDLR